MAERVTWVETMPGVYVWRAEIEKLLARRRYLATASASNPKPVTRFPLDSDPYAGPMLRRLM